MARKSTPREDTLEREIRLLRNWIDAMKIDPGDMPLQGCGDGSCIVAKGPGGMHTNGGCRCDERRLRQAVMWWRRVAEFRLVTIDEMRKAKEPTDE